MEVSARASRAEPTPRRAQAGETYSAATRSRTPTSTQPIAAPSTATHTSWSRIARAMRSAAARVAHFSACSIDIAGHGQRENGTDAVYLRALPRQRLQHAESASSRLHAAERCTLSGRRAREAREGTRQRRWRAVRSNVLLGVTPETVVTLAARLR